MENLLKIDDLQHEVLQEIVRQAQSGQMPSEDQVAQIKSCFLDDSSVSKVEAEFLFYLKREFPDIVNVTGFDDIFVKIQFIFIKI